MQFSTARAEVAAQLSLDQTQSDTTTLINRWLNLSQLDIASAWNWTWLKDRDVITTELDLATGTVDATAASATITFSSAPAASQTDRFIQFSSADDWYKITAHTAGVATATISPVYAQTSNLTAGTFTVRTFFYSLATTTEYVYTARTSQNPAYLPVISASLVDQYAPFWTDTGSPKKIILWGKDSSGNVQFSPFPWPDEILLIEFRVYKKPSDLSADSDTPLFPTRFDSMWIDGALAYGYRYLNDDRADKTRRDFLLKVDNLKDRDNPGLTSNRILKSIDEGSHQGHPFIPFPSNFGEVWRR